MVVGWTLHALQHGSFRCHIVHCNPLRKPPASEYESRRKYRQQLWSLWLNSVADDLDLLTDWWFFARTYNEYGLGSNAVLALLAFAIAGTISYLLELYQTAFLYPDSAFEWLSLFTIVCEDVPQIILSLVISNKFADPSPLATFNIATSLYSALIKISGELFLNWFYCCKFGPAEQDEEDEGTTDHRGVVVNVDRSVESSQRYRNIAAAQAAKKP